MAGMYPDNRTINLYGKEVNWPDVDETGKFTDGDFSDPEVPPSYIPAATINLILDNLSELIKGAGEDPDNTQINQLKNLLSQYPSAQKIAQYSADGQLQSSNPVTNLDTVNKIYLMDLLSQSPSAQKIAQYDAGGRLQGATPTNNRDLVNRESMFNLLLPVGFVYTQYPGCNTPAGMWWPGSWEMQFSSEGVFFRTEGGKAGGFRNTTSSYGIQEDAFQDHKVTLNSGKGSHSHGMANHSHRHRIQRGRGGTSFGTSYVETLGSYQGSAHTDYTSHSHTINYATLPSMTSDGFTHLGSGAPRTANETRPRNRTIRIWKRTA